MAAPTHDPLSHLAVRAGQVGLQHDWLARALQPDDHIGTQALAQAQHGPEVAQVEGDVRLLLCGGDRGGAALRGNIYWKRGCCPALGAQSRVPELCE